MTCLICLEDTNNKIVTNCKCKLACHDTCFKSFLEHSKFSCPICRIKRKTINNDSNLIHIIFKLPVPVALPSWIVISILFTVFVFPFIAIREFYGKNITLMTYAIIIYFTKMTIIMYFMLLTHFSVLCLDYFNIRIV